MLMLNPTIPMKLGEAIEIFVKKRHLNSDTTQRLVAVKDWQNAVKQINKALWNYVGIFDGSITELFQQLEQVGLEQWHVRLSHVVGTIKEILLHKMEDLLWSIKRLENQLWKARLACEPSTHLHRLWIKLSRLWTHLIDRKLPSHLKRNQELLNTQYQRFIKRYRSFLQLQDQVDKHLETFTEYHVLSSLDRETQIQFLKLYQLLKLWELNRTAKTLSSQEFLIAIRNSLSVDKAVGLFRDYYHALKAKLFERSHYIKNNAAELAIGSLQLKRVEELIEGYQAETHLLGATIGHYREFLLRADPDPYVRTRLGYSDWIVGPEPIQTKPLLNLGYDVEALSEMFTKLSSSLNKNRSEIQQERERIEQEIHGSLQELGHPLASQRFVRTHVENTLEQLQKLDELGSFDATIIEIVGENLAKLLRTDWKYHVAFGSPLFHQLYSIHQGLTTPIVDRHHQNRLHHFQRYIKQILEWIKAQKTQAHAHDIELDMNDIKGYLQDFLGYIQRNFNEPHMTHEKAMALNREITHELLEYRYLFGNFFYRLRQYEREGQLIRRQFLFVDQYFESIEYKVYELMRQSWPEYVSEKPVNEETQDESDD